jgi:hypothetical protein
MTIRKWISILVVLALLLPSAGGAAQAMLAPAEAGHGCCPSQAAGAAEPAPDAAHGIHDDCAAGCAGQCDACVHCIGLALPSTTSTRCPETPSGASGFAPGAFPRLFPPVELRPPRTLA